MVSLHNTIIHHKSTYHLPVTQCHVFVYKKMLVSWGRKIKAVYTPTKLWIHNVMSMRISLGGGRFEFYWWGVAWKRRVWKNQRIQSVNYSYCSNDKQLLLSIVQSWNYTLVFMYIQQSLSVCPAPRRRYRWYTTDDSLSDRKSKVEERRTEMLDIYLENEDTGRLHT